MNQHYNKLGFKIPQNYFKESKEQIVSSLNTNEKNSTIKNILSTYIYPIAAIFIGGLISYTFLNFKTESFEYDQNSPIIYSIISEEDISDEDILEYFTNNLAINEIKIPK
jgi:hypothetical protein|tara:strand:- start:24 stop:353 length:330 start_codon:yes stop_codon:yes gene_type:complete